MTLKDSNLLPVVHPSSISTRKTLKDVLGAVYVCNCCRYKTATGSTQYRFGVLAKIVKHMRKRHQDGETYPLSLEEILDETNQLDVGNKVKQVNLRKLLTNRVLMSLFSVAAN
jgi:hypothetical protein